MALSVDLITGSNIDLIRAIHEAFEPLRPRLNDDFPKDELGLAVLLLADDARAVLVSDGERPIGVFLINRIVPNQGAWSHVFIWDRHNLPYKELIATARHFAKAMMETANLRRLTGLTPCDNLRARLFAEEVGFVVEGRLADAVMMGGMPMDAWISGLTPQRLAEAEARAQTPPKPATLEETELSNV